MRTKRSLGIAVSMAPPRLPSPQARKTEPARGTSPGDACIAPNATSGNPSPSTSRPPATGSPRLPSPVEPYTRRRPLSPSVARSTPPASPPASSSRVSLELHASSASALARPAARIGSTLPRPADARRLGPQRRRAGELDARRPKALLNGEERRLDVTMAQRGDSQAEASRRREQRQRMLGEARREPLQRPEHRHVKQVHAIAHPPDVHQGTRRERPH